MQDLPDFENPGYNSGSSMHEYHPRPGLEPVPTFETASSVTLQIQVLRETYDEIMRVVVDNEWEREEGLRNVLLSGLGFLDAKERLENINRAASGGNLDIAGHLDTLVNDLASYHQQYSVMKFKAFKLYKVNQVLEFNISGLRETERMWEAWAARMRKQHAQMQSEVIRLRALMSEFKLDWDSPIRREGGAALDVEKTTEPKSLSAQPNAEPEPPVVFFKDEPRLSLWQRVKRFLGAGGY